MAWIERFDERAAAWPPLARLAYLSVKWYLVGIGALALTRVALDRTGVWPFFH